MLHACVLLYLFYNERLMYLAFLLLKKQGRDRHCDRVIRKLVYTLLLPLVSYPYRPRTKILVKMERQSFLWGTETSEMSSKLMN